MNEVWSNPGKSLNLVKEGTLSAAALEKQANQHSRRLLQAFQQCISEIEEQLKKVPTEDTSAAATRQALRQLADCCEQSRLTIEDAVQQLLIIISHLTRQRGGDRSAEG